MFQVIASGRINANGSLAFQGSEGGISTSSFAIDRYSIELATACDNTECLIFVQAVFSDSSMAFASSGVRLLANDATIQVRLQSAMDFNLLVIKGR